MRRGSSVNDRPGDGAPGPWIGTWGAAETAGDYFLAQQSPGQQAEPDWQQLAPQQAPQQLAPGVQHESPVKANADSDESARTITANSLYFIAISSRLNARECMRRRNEASGRRGADRHTGRSRF